MIARAALAAALLCASWSKLAHAQPRALFDTPSASSTDPLDGQPTAPAIVSRPLDPPSGIGTGLPADLSAGWADTPPSTIGEALNALPAVPADPTARDMQIGLLKLPTPPSEPPGSLLAARLQLLVQLGDLDDARSILNGMTSEQSGSPELVAVAATIDLASGRDPQACGKAAGVGRLAPGLGEVNLFCAIERNDLDAAQVLNDALKDTQSLRAQPFGALVQVAFGFGSADAVDWSAVVEPVDVALADHAGIRIPDGAVTQASLAAVSRLSEDSDSSPTVLAAARTRQEEASGRLTTTGPEATRLRAIVDPAERAEAIVELWRTTQDAGLRRAYLPQLAPLAVTIAPRVALSEQAPTVTEILLAAGEEGAALTWFDMLETQRAGDRRASDRVAVLMILAGLIDSSRMPTTPASLFDDSDARWLAAGLRGQGIDLSSPWARLLTPSEPSASGAPALKMAKALANVAADDPNALARGLSGLSELDHGMDALAIARSAVIIQLHG